MTDFSTKPATVIRLAALTVALGALTGCLRPWAEAAPEFAAKPPAPPVVTTIKDETPSVPAAPVAVSQPDPPRRLRCVGERSAYAAPADLSERGSFKNVRQLSYLGLLSFCTNSGL